MRNRSLQLFAVALAATITGSLNAQNPAPVNVANPSFEADQLYCSGYCFYPNITGWLVGPSTGVQKNSSTLFPGGLPEGVNFAYVGGSNSSGSITQILGATVKANATYTLKMSIGSQLGIGLDSYLAALMSDGVILASDNTLRPAQGTFLDEVIVYKSGPRPAQLGKPLVIFVQSIGYGQVDVDAVALTVQ